MLGYDTDARVSFRKGCYTGQEIVARAHYKGGVKRHLQRLLGRGQPPAPGSALERAGVSAGTIVESAASAEGCCEVLAVIADDHATPASDTPLLAGGLELHLPA
jgi:folate-binding Fe-S cluster repair protein YgfZ